MPNYATRWRLRLNNLLQRSRYTSQSLRWSSPHREGPDNNCIWSIIAYINGVEYGQGRDRTLDGAKEVAAYRAFGQLHHEMYGSYPTQPFSS
ncbi:hypothetical protein EIP91_001290 [Steccherinum ochraceum]|uniref:DRBM domain-containing protein n=1 Tax=Steccherinum ochraceum TaxID=92696 RepID=A0A4R0RUZ4_9APHY|nr:hypothetical protein EIP91_001290 [Steccherinum ochraceum]